MSSLRALLATVTGCCLIMTAGRVVVASSSSSSHPTQEMGRVPVMKHKQCLHSEPVGQFCEVPTVPERICHGPTCRGPHDGTSVCSVVAHALLKEFDIFDVVVVNSGLCHDEIQAGPLTREDVDAVLPYNQELVVLKVNGSDLLAALEHGLDLSHFHGIHDAYPETAGIRFHVNLNTPYGNRISRPEVLNSNCEWKPLRARDTYHMLTNEALANGYFDYSPLTKAISRTGTRAGVTDIFWQHSQSVCTLRDPYPRPPVYRRRNSKPKAAAGVSACPAKHS